MDVTSIVVPQPDGFMVVGPSPSGWFPRKAGWTSELVEEYLRRAEGEYDRGLADYDAGGEYDNGYEAGFKDGKADI